MLEASALRGPEQDNPNLDTHKETQDEFLSHLDDEALRDLAETGTVEDVRAVVEMLIEENPELRPYLIEFQEANSEALASELQKAAANELREPQSEDDEIPEEEMNEYIEQAQSYLYEALDIDEDQNNNRAITNFAKGIIDTLIFENADLALEVIETRGQVLLDALKELATWRGIKQMLQALGESIWDLFSGDAYEKGKAVADLGLVATGVGVSATLGRRAIKSAVRHLDAPSPRNLDRALLDDIASLPEPERLEAAGVFLGRDIPENQKQAILDAHNVGERLPDGSYSLGDLREKTRILQEAGLTSGEIRTLFDNNICGKEFPDFRNLYEDPRFDYLGEYRDILGDITERDIIGEGNNAIIMRHPEHNDRVLKIAKPNSSHRLFDEFENHQEFREFLEDFRSSSIITEEEKAIIEGFHIPEITQLRDGLYEMERIQGNSFKSLVHLDYHRSHLQGIPENLYDGVSSHDLLQIFENNGVSVADMEYFRANGISDSNIMQFLQDRGLFTYPHARDTGTQWDRPETKEMANAWRGLDVKTERLDVFHELLRRHGYEHRDNHWGNFLIREDGEIFLIDFGIAEIRYNKTLLD